MTSQRMVTASQPGANTASSRVPIHSIVNCQPGPAPAGGPEFPDGRRARRGVRPSRPIGRKDFDGGLRTQVVQLEHAAGNPHRGVGDSTMIRRDGQIATWIGGWRNRFRRGGWGGRGWSGDGSSHRTRLPASRKRAAKQKHNQHGRPDGARSGTGQGGARLGPRIAGPRVSVTSPARTSTKRHWSRRSWSTV